MTDHWYLGNPDRRQNRRLDDLESDVRVQQAAQRSHLRTLESKLAKVRGSLEQRVNALSRAMGAFVELTDVREELREFPAEAAARKAALNTLDWLTERSAASPGRPVVDVTASYGSPDVAGYWLPAAAEALVAVVRDDHSAAREAETRATERDPQRSALFLCLGLLLAGRPDLALDQLDRAMALQPTEPVTHAQRFLWHQAAAGAFGEAGRLHLERNLATLVEKLPKDETDTAIGAWSEWLTAADRKAMKSSTSVPANVRGRRAQGTLALLGTPAIAANQLDRLHAWIQTRMSEAGEERHGLGGIIGQPDLHEDCHQLLRQLISEGSAPERPLLERYHQLRAIVDANTEAEADADNQLAGEQEPATAASSGSGLGATPWDQPVGLPGELMHNDAVSEPRDHVAGDPDADSLQRIALQALRPVLLQVSDALAGEATKPMPGEIELRVEGHPIRFNAQGPTPESVNKARETVEAQTEEPSAQRLGMGWTIVAGGVVVMVFALLSMQFLLIPLGLVGLGAGGWRVVAERAHRREEKQQMTRRRWSRLNEAIDKHGDTVTQLRREATDAASQATQTGEAITTFLQKESAANLDRW